MTNIIIQISKYIIILLMDAYTFSCFSIEHTYFIIKNYSFIRNYLKQCFLFS